MLSLEKQLLFLVSSAGGIDVKRLVEIYEARGVDHQVVRNALLRMKKEGYLRSGERSKYQITQHGLDFITTINQKSLLLGKSWDGQWLTVMFEVPEAERKKRDALRGYLLQLGFGALYKSVYIAPWDYAEEVVRFAKHCEIEDRLTLLRGAFVSGQPQPLTVNRLWPTDELNEVYRAKMEWFRAAFATAIAPLLREPGDGLALFVRFLELGELLADLSLRDPMLPEELLDDNWLGRTCFQDMQQGLRQLADAIPAQSPYRKFVHRFVQD
ncbi:PaaX family transcriptional regulator C-terminal domain-containing protein [Paenibacillus methanolicus]|uniref:Phenylacetic acid degradation operon negative regulatory protein n=1 Tax=Paenibacillus methanolicus TaxID=582686 RepID=A0A5S5C3U9_9BACL|nr:PaaX family transcriptional regulator C-terminal domain-containing protein [Paenibacillus methanolicus]TYP74105.1 phenylacetic acid degradation operon negative regulatory protein [Paenibacillus methanolicus]